MTQPDHYRVGPTTCSCGHEATSIRTIGGHLSGTQSSKLTRDQVVEIKRLLRASEEATDPADKVTQRELADRYGVNKATISCLMTGRSWKHVD